ncbi:MAG: hypothetical protein Ct9H90mP13_04840 [Pseudomonadota bacterium]|nr:MAG: hypothetical protein Ct9H90mP13_04840 [Pseudomonadota bacterium]
MMAAALENQIYQADDTIDTSPYKIGSRTIQDPRYHGVLSMEEVLIKSSNTGISKIALELDPCNLYTFFNGLGLAKSHLLVFLVKHQERSIINVADGEKA